MFLGAVFMGYLLAVFANENLLTIFASDLAKITEDRMVRSSGDVILRDNSQIAFASGRAAQALLVCSLEYIKAVIESKFLVFMDVPEGENTDADFAEDMPFLGFTVGFTGVVDESRQVSFSSRVNHFLL